MDIQRAVQIAKREWENIRLSLQMCGDIGEFDSINHISNCTSIVSETLPLIRNLIEMENKLSTYGYFTPEAGYVFTYLASRAGERLGLSYKLAQTFGRGYGWIRTGWFDLESVERRHLIKQIIFFKLFFPLGRDFISWDFNSPAVKAKLKAVVYKFAAWQSNPDSYIQDIRECKEQLEPLWYGLSLAMNLNEEFSEFITA
ncbi:MAG: hypothetical protein ACM3SR_03620 [Ignavibacteriales bacterium]